MYNLAIFIFFCYFPDEKKDENSVVYENEIKM